MLLTPKTPDPAKPPLLSEIFGYGPMIPFVIGAMGVWALSPPWPTLALHLTILWGALILSFVAGVRRGFGFGSPAASTLSEIGTMLVYFTCAGGALLLATFDQSLFALGALTSGYALVAVLDARGARRGDAPCHFARLRPRQMAIAVISLLALIIRVTVLHLR